jgi:hypothetical protein
VLEEHTDLIAVAEPGLQRDEEVDLANFAPDRLAKQHHGVVGALLLRGETPVLRVVVLEASEHRVALRMPHLLRRDDGQLLRDDRVGDTTHPVAVVAVPTHVRIAPGAVVEIGGPHVVRGEPNLERSGLGGSSRVARSRVGRWRSCVGRVRIGGGPADAGVLFADGRVPDAVRGA